MIRYFKNPLAPAFTAAALACLTVLTAPAWATVTFDWATVGNPGNAAAPIFGVGAVANTYRISKTEVTNAQYAEFLNAAAASDPNSLYNTNMGSNPRGGLTRSGASGSFTYATKANMANKPVNYVSFLDAMRFTNWLHNGQGAGSTETGVYNIGDGTSETRDPNASFFIPSKDEWYKAAYHQPAAQGGDSDNYWLYPTASNSIPTVATANSVGDIANPGTNVANYKTPVGGASWNGLITNVTTVGSAGPGSASFYGTFDQGGNVFEWNETLIAGFLRGIIGGSLADNVEFMQASAVNNNFVPSGEAFSIGFRVASPVPAIIGDLDGDGFVGITDLNLVLGNWNQNVPPANPLADPSGDGFIGIDDLNAVLGNWNAGTPPPASSPVPEPASVALLTVGAPLLLRRRKG
jgi:formylglycine-generating enzyme required for sulfatase activity